MSYTNFLTKTNISTIWDVISDEEIFKYLPRNTQSKISEVFTSNLKGFYENEIQKSTNLINMNKKYIVLMLGFIKNNYPQQPSKITILEEISPTNQKSLITYEEIQNDRKSQFEKELSVRQEEFTNAMTLKPPPVPEFTDKFEDAPITEMEKMIKEMTAQRNYDVEQINSSFFASQTSNENWLKSQETSIKNEKFQNEPVDAKSSTNVGAKLKYLKIDNQEVSLNGLDTKKNVTWSENITNEIEKNDNLNEQYIFSKLKRIETKPYVNNLDIKKNILSISKRLSEMQEEMTKMQEFLKSLA